MASNVSNFILDKYFTSDADITWSFDYSLSGGSGTDGGFTTFLTYPMKFVDVGDGPTLAVMPDQNHDGIYNAAFSIAIDSTGLYGTKSSLIPSGLDTPIPNSLIVRGTNFEFLTAIPLTNINLTGLTNSEVYKRIRINCTNVGRTLNISTINEYGSYEIVYSITRDFGILNDSSMQIGFSQVSPINQTNNKSILTIKDIQVQGILTTRKYKPSNLILISPYRDYYRTIYKTNKGFLFNQQPPTTTTG